MIAQKSTIELAIKAAESRKHKERLEPDWDIAKKLKGVLDAAYNAKPAPF
jgi:hypothetical protein